MNLNTQDAEIVLFDKMGKQIIKITNIYGPQTIKIPTKTLPPRSNLLQLRTANYVENKIIVYKNRTLS